MSNRKSRWILVVLFAAAPGVAMAASVPLPPVTMSSGCALVHPADLTGTFDSEGANLLLVLTAAGVHGLPADWPSADLETVGGHSAGDGIPDYYQMALLGSLLCAGNGTIQSQFDSNVAAYHGFIGYVVSVLTNAGAQTLGPEMTAVAADITAWANGLSDPPYGSLKAQAQALADALSQAAPLISAVGGAIGSLDGFKEWFGGMAGLSTEMQDSMHGLLDPLIVQIPSFAGDLMTLAGGLALLTQTPVPPLTQGLLTECVTLTNDLINGATILQNGQFTVPTFVIFNLTKSPSQPFSAFGDYDLDGNTNLATYDAITGAGGGRPEFVAAASGYDPFWTGNPGLPVAGGLGLALVCGACALAGARGLRKK